MNTPTQVLAVLSLSSGLLAQVAPTPNAPIGPGANPPGPVGTPGQNGNANDPLSSMVAVTLKKGSAFSSIPALVKARVRQMATNSLPSGVTFPLANVSDDSVRTLAELQHNVVVSWLDPLTTDNSYAAPRFGANCDYTAYFGFGWNFDWASGGVGSPPQFNGLHNIGHIWVNHEYISNSSPSTSSAPTGQHLTFAKYLKKVGVLKNDVTSNTWSQADVDTHLNAAKREFGGSYFTVWQNPADNQWHLIKWPSNRRYDATSNTRLRITGFRSSTLDHDDLGDDLPLDVVTGLLGDCSGGQTPWGTIFTAEENVQGYYGDLETAWNSSQRFIRNAGFDACANVNPTFAPSRSGLLGRITNVSARHNRDNYGFLAEVDVPLTAQEFYKSVADKGDGSGHRKLGAMGRARWENMCVATDGRFRLVDGQKIVLYGGNDRRSGRIWKFVSKEAYKNGMSKGQVRALLDEGSLYVAHLAGLDHRTGKTMFATGSAPTEAAPGKGRWIHYSVDSLDIAPNATALGKAGTTVGDALKSNDYNRIGGFPTDNDALMALFTGAAKLGITELNRPEDIDYNPNDVSGTPRLYVAFTNHTRQVQADQDGVIFDPEKHAIDSPKRDDPTGSIFAIQEGNPSNPDMSMSFDFFMVWNGSKGTGPHDLAAPDNIAIDQNGGVWFGTDGNFGNNGTADALYYLDLDPKNKAGQPGVVNATFGKAFRFAATPSDAEATGPAWNSNQGTLFFNVQHPGERNPSTWPN